MYRDFKELLSVLSAHDVRFLVVGAYAVSVHAQPRATKDLDLFVKPDAENAGRRYAALVEFGAPLEGLTSADFAESGPFFHMGREPIAVDIMTEIPAVEFDVAWENRIDNEIDPTTGLKASFISKDDLIRSKLASRRPQDLADVDAIRRAKESRPQGPRS